MNRRPTPSVLDAVLSADIAPDRTMLRSRLRYDYSAVPAVHRKAVEDAAIDILANGERMKESAIVVGERLLDVKQRLDHGQFSDWCDTEFQMSQRVAQHMMNVARTFGGKSETVSFLSDSVLYLLAAPSTPEPAREAVIEQAKATGRTPTKAEAKAIIEQHKPARTPYAAGFPPLDLPANPTAPAWTQNGQPLTEPAPTTADVQVLQPMPAADTEMVSMAAIARLGQVIGTALGAAAFAPTVEAGLERARELLASAPPADDRRTRLNQYATQFEATLEALRNWAQLTGRFTLTSEAERGLRKVIEATRSQLAALNGQPHQAWGEEAE